MLQNEMVKRKYVDEVSHETIRMVLTPALAGGAREKTNSSRG